MLLHCDSIKEVPKGYRKISVDIFHILYKFLRVELPGSIFSLPNCPTHMRLKYTQMIME